MGEIALLSDAPRTATVTLTSPVTALRATRKGFSELLKTSPSIQQKLLTTLAERLANRSSTPDSRARSTLDSSAPQWLAYDGATGTSAASEVRLASPAVRNTVFSFRFERRSRVADTRWS